MVYTATATPSENISLRIDDNFLYVKGNVAGQHMVTVIATDPFITTASLAFQVTVNIPENNSPVSIGSIPDKNIVVGEEVRLNLSGNFSDPDLEALTYSVSLSDASIAEGVVTLDQLSIVAMKAGTTMISVTATDPHSASVTQVFNLSSIENVVLQVPESKEMAYSFSPNPFMETLRCSISIPVDAYIRLSIMDPLGKIVMTPMAGLYSKGEVNESIRLVDCPPGIYFYSLLINGSVFSGKLIKYGH
jgi:hypothetical protein